MKELKQKSLKIIEEKLKQFENYEMMIDLTELEYIKVKIKNEKGEKEIVEINEGENKTKIMIEFDEEEMKIGKETNKKQEIKNVYKEIYENPQNIKLYKIEYDKKEYEITGEVIMAIILNKYK